MSSQPETAKGTLTPYELRQVREIAAWKSRPFNPFAELFRRVALPGARAATKLIPDELVRVSVEKAYGLAEVLAGQEDIKRRAGIQDLSEMQWKPLEECDRIAKRIAIQAELVTLAEGAATGAGGPLTTLIDIPVLFVLALRTILKIGHCYGYRLDRPYDGRYVLGVLLTATSGSREMRQERLGQLADIEEWLLEEAQLDLVAEELASFLFQLEVFEEVPGVGLVSGALLNLSFMRRVNETTRWIFQERLLRDNGKVVEISPADVPSLTTASGWAGVANRAAYSVSYTLGFVVGFPAWSVVSCFRPLNGAAVRFAVSNRVVVEREKFGWCERSPDPFPEGDQEVTQT